jgi:hypothetical protein
LEADEWSVKNESVTCPRHRFKVARDGLASPLQCEAEILTTQVTLRIPVVATMFRELQNET